MRNHGGSDDFIDSLFEEGKNSLGYGGRLSQSNLTAFKYTRNLPQDCNGDSFIHCPCHSDISLLTIIPKSMGCSASGLLLFDYELGKWIDVEVDAPDDIAFVFTGESTTHITNGKFLPVRLIPCLTYSHFNKNNTYTYYGTRACMRSPI